MDIRYKNAANIYVIKTIKVSEYEYIYYKLGSKVE